MYPAKYVPATGQPGLLVSSAESSVFLPLIQNEEDNSSSAMTFSISYPASDADLEAASSVIPEADPVKGLNGSMYIFRFGEGVFNFTVPFMYRTDPLWNGTILLYGAGKDKTVINDSSQFFIYHQPDNYDFNYMAGTLRVELQNLTVRSTYNGDGLKNTIWLRNGNHSLRMRNVKIERIPETPSDLIDQGIINVNPPDANTPVNQDKLYLENCDFAGCLRCTVMSFGTIVARKINFIPGKSGGYLYPMACTANVTDYATLIRHQGSGYSSYDTYRMNIYNKTDAMLNMDLNFIDLSTLEEQ